MLHGPNLGIVFCLFCALLCWVSFIGVLHRGFACMALIWAFLCGVFVSSCAGSLSMVYCTEVFAGWP